MKQAVKSLAGALLGSYALYRIGRFADVPPLPLPDGATVQAVGRDEIAAAECPTLRENAWYAGDEAQCYALFLDDRMHALACFWWGARYCTRASWPIGASEVKLVQIVTSPQARGRGLAPVLAQRGYVALRGAGHTAAYARIWHNHRASIQALARAGWRQVGWMAQYDLLGRGRPRSMLLHTSARTQAN